MRRGFKVEEKPTALTFEQQIAVAWAYFCEGVAQSTIAGMYGINQGRIAETCKTVREALEPKKEKPDAEV
jgi:DNA-binding transcriptional regulator LsrR (DeoR family)